MTRSLIFLVCIVCVATVLTQLVGAGFLWMQGRLNANSLAEIRSILSGEEREIETADDDSKKSDPLSTNDVVDKRIERVWNLDRRQKELAIINGMVTERVDQLTNRRKKFEQNKDTVLADLKQQSKRLLAESTEQARGILIKMTPADAVQNLMALDLPQNVVLLKGMPDKNVAELLQEFQRSNDPKHIERAQQVFEAISDGQPKRKVLDTGLSQLAPPKTAKKQP